MENLTEREALNCRIEYMYHHLSRNLIRINREEFSLIPPRVNTDYFHTARRALMGEFAQFEKADLSKTLFSLKNTAPLEDVRTMHGLLEETLACWNIMPAMSPVNALMQGRFKQGHRVENVTPDMLIPKNERDNYWLLTKEGYLEFHGGGYLRNEYGPVMADYCGGDAIGSSGIETGLWKIFDYAVQNRAERNGKGSTPGKITYDRDRIIDTMLGCGLNYYVNSDIINERREWYWDLRENLDNRESTRIKLPAEIIEYYRQFEPGWKPVEGGFIGADYTNEKGNAKYHTGVDWVWRCNNRNETTGQPVYSTTDGVIPEDGIRRNPEGDGLGKLVRVLCRDGARIDYFHLDSVLQILKIGDFVKEGQLLGYAGNTGYGGAHLHIAKSYKNTKLANSFNYIEQFTLGNELQTNEYLQYYRKGMTEPGARAYVIPPVPYIQ